MSTPYTCPLTPHIKTYQTYQLLLSAVLTFLSYFHRTSVLWRRQTFYLPGWLPHHSLWQSKWWLLWLPGRFRWARCVFFFFMASLRKKKFLVIDLGICFVKIALLCDDANIDQFLFYFLYRNCCLSQWQLPLHQCWFPTNVHPFLPCQWWNMWYDIEPVQFIPRFVIYVGFILMSVFQHTDCCDTMDEYNSGAACQNTCR